jgi:uncharacterized DUF497 family protein
VRFQYDPGKAAANLRKHGVSFADAEGALEDPLAVTVEDPDAEGEKRPVTVGMGSAGELCWLSSTPSAAMLAGSFRRGAQRRRNGDPMRAEYDFSKGKRGAVIPQKGKTRISIFIDNSILEAFRARAEKAGTGYQTMMNDALRQYLSEADQPVTEKTLRQVLRQEMPEYLRSLAPRPTRKR